MHIALKFAALFQLLTLSSRLVVVRANDEHIAREGLVDFAQLYRTTTHDEGVCIYEIAESASISHVQGDLNSQLHVQAIQKEAPNFFECSTYRPVNRDCGQMVSFLFTLNIDDGGRGYVVWYISTTSCEDLEISMHFERAVVACFGKGRATIALEHPSTSHAETGVMITFVTAYEGPQQKHFGNLFTHLSNATRLPESGIGNEDLCLDDIEKMIPSVLPLLFEESYYQDNDASTKQNKARLRKKQTKKGDGLRSGSSTPILIPGGENGVVSVTADSRGYTFGMSRHEYNAGENFGRGHHHGAVCYVFPSIAGAESLVLLSLSLWAAYCQIKRRTTNSNKSSVPEDQYQQPDLLGMGAEEGEGGALEQSLLHSDGTTRL